MANEAVWSQLRELLGDRFSTAAAVRSHHAKDVSTHPPIVPDAVVYPTTTDDVCRIVAIASEHRLPIVPYGAGTSAEGHIHAIHGGLVIDLSRMNRILAVRPDDLDCTVEPGVTRLTLNRVLRADGLHFPVDPGADATIGGMISTGASGTTTVRFGTIKENVLGLTVVLPDATVVKAGGRSRKSSAGYNIKELFIGAEGTLGIITEATLKIYGLPEAIAAAVASFGNLEGAIQASIDIIRAGVPVARVELMDEVQMKASVHHHHLPYPIGPTLFLEFHGTDASVKEQAAIAGEIAKAHGVIHFSWAAEAEKRAQLWKARHEAYFALIATRPGHEGWPTDVCVPFSQLAEHIALVRNDITAAGLYASILGHVGDGNFHVIFVVDPSDPVIMSRAKAVNERMIDRAIAAGGTCTGEHGIGHGKIGALAREHGDLLPMMRKIKQTLDPLGIMNPGKIIESTRSFAA